MDTCNECGLSVDPVRLREDLGYWLKKAPEGATHYDPNGFVFMPCVHWWKQNPADNRGWKVWHTVAGEWLEVVADDDFVARPEET